MRSKSEKCYAQKVSNFLIRNQSRWERIIVPLDRRSGQLKSTLPGCPTLSTPVAGVEEVFYTSLFYTGCPTLYVVEEAGVEEEDLFKRSPSSTPAGGR